RYADKLRRTSLLGCRKWSLRHCRRHSRIKTKRGLALLAKGHIAQREAGVYAPPPTVDPVAEPRDQEMRGWYDTLDNVTQAKLGDQMLKKGLAGQTAGITLALARTPFPGAM